MVDLERGLSDAMLAREHTELMGGLDDVLNLEAGLAQVEPPGPSSDRPWQVEGLTELADQLSELPAAERLATRAWLPMRLLVETRSIATCAVHAHLVTNAFSGAGPFNDIHTFDAIRFALAEALLAVCTIDHPQAQSLVDTLVGLQNVMPSAEAAHDRVRHHTNSLGKRLAKLLIKISRASEGESFFRYIFLHAARVRQLGGPHELIELAKALPGLIDKMLSAVTSMVGADLSSADLNGLPLEGVHWSSDTRWPHDWVEWVRANSVPVSADVFEIRPGKAGSWLTT
ncbi:hypothetical protein ACFOWZ_26735 [Lentzea rhizosphaerae]|uniref:Uncharacterized protein n=1 Tax=Lentzea rhizosphaerae TaxID=2041025 RepID=A0ABV8BZJ9_9PSEU